MNDNKNKIGPWLAPLLLVLSVFVFFSEIWITRKPLFGSDFVLYFHPWKHYLYNHFQSTGEIPLWNPYVLSGTPYLADLQTSPFYPLGFLFYLIPTDQAYTYTVMLHWVFGILTIYYFARSIPLRRGASCLASIIFSYNGYVVGHLYAGHLTFVQNYFWIPLIFLFALKFVHNQRWRYAAWCGFFLGIQILGGFPQIAFYTILATLLLFAYAYLHKRKTQTAPKWYHMCQGTAIFLILGFTLSAIQLLPTYEFTNLSTRSGGVSYEFATTDSFPPIHFLTFLMPNLFGNPVNGTYWKSTEVWQFWELCGYVGLGSLLLLLCLKGSQRSILIKRFFLLLWGLSLFLSLGKYNPLYNLIYYLPGFHHFRIPAQILFLHVFAVSMLAGLAFDRLASDNGTKVKWFSRPFVFLSGGLLVVLALAALGYWWDKYQFLEIALTLIKPNGAIPDLGTKVARTIPLSVVSAFGLLFLFVSLLTLCSRRIIGRTPFVVLFLLATVGDLWSFGLPMVKTTSLHTSGRNEQLTPTAGENPDLFRMVSMGRNVGPRESILYGYHDIHGYTPMILKRYLQYLNKSQGLDMTPEAVNVRYVTDIGNNMIRLLNIRFAALDSGRMSEMARFLPRAFIVHNAKVLPSDKVLDYLVNTQFSPEDVVVLEENVNIRSGFTESKSQRGNEGSTLADEGQLLEESCRIVFYAKDNMIVKARLKKPGYLVLSEIDYPGWNAYIEKERVNILTANYIFRTIPLPTGDHTVHLRLESHTFIIGIAVSTTVLLGFLSFQMIIMLRNRFSGHGDA